MNEKATDVLGSMVRLVVAAIEVSLLIPNKSLSKAAEADKSNVELDENLETVALTRALTTATQLLISELDSDEAFNLWID